MATEPEPEAHGHEGSSEDMDHRRISELMTRDVVSVRPETPFKEIARALADHDISAVPVVDTAGRPVGEETNQRINGSTQWVNESTRRCAS
ncbi:CBS domain-containing protein [Streptomyces odonnellii]|uniref:CBS domain-containing protein n=1 Tax=Streptomyces odonnellii TaxID=1417980 RepID=UPI000A73A6B6